MRRWLAAIGTRRAVHNLAEPERCVCGRETCCRYFDGRTWTVLCAMCALDRLETPPVKEEP